MIDINKDEDIGVITTYISCEIWFDTSVIEYPYEVQKKLASLFDKVNESRVMQIEKDMTYLDPHSFEKIEYYLDRVKEL